MLVAHGVVDRLLSTRLRPPAKPREDRIVITLIAHAEQDSSPRRCVTGHSGNGPVRRIASRYERETVSDLSQSPISDKAASYVLRGRVDCLYVLVTEGPEALRALMTRLIVAGVKRDAASRTGPAG
ncbi:MAG: hypothetical protein FWD95_11570 [Nocardioidaceae bacterium]|nr:hypothetical protein [Nocardioidaceae bacterium]